MAKDTCCTCRGPELGSQHPCRLGSSQSLVTLDPGHLMPSSDLSGYPHSCGMQMHTIKIKSIKKKGIKEEKEGGGRKK